MEINTLAVIGAGQMGSGIAQVAAQSGLNVILVDAAPEALQKGYQKIKEHLDRAVLKGRMADAERQAVLARIKTTTSITDCAPADFAVEAVIENLEAKEKVFKQLDQTLRPEVIVATNTSSIPITRIAACTRRPHAVVGMHFMNPVPAMKLVEVIRGAQTADSTYQATQKLAALLNKTTVTSRDFPGFIVNRVLVPMINEACYALMEGMGTRDDIDTAMKLGTNHPMGPLELADFIGLDTVLYIAEILHKGYGDDKYRPCPLLRQYVEAGWLGRKTGRGFYTY
jgi:3-hydroxybutyryl-CoA dehydrogenase